MFVIHGDAPFVPGMCLVTKQGPGGPFVDLGRDFDNDHVGRMYVHVSAVRDMWNECKHLYETERVDTRDERIAELERENQELEAALEAVHVLKAKGYSAQRKPGRKPNKVKEPANGS